MIGKGIVEQRNVTLAEAKSILEKAKKAEEEPSYEQKVTYEYAKEFSKLSPTKSKKLVSELLESVSKLDEHSAIMIANIMPTTKEDVILITEKKRFSLVDGDITKILDIVKKNA